MHAINPSVSKTVKHWTHLFNFSDPCFSRMDTKLPILFPAVLLNRSIVPPTRTYPSMPYNAARHAALSPENQGPYVVVTSYIMMCIMISSTIARLRPGRIFLTRTLTSDEVLLVLACV